MTTSNRQTMMFEYIQMQKVATVAQLARHFHVSEMTVRRDLVALEQAALIVRSHGKAEILEQQDIDIKFSQRAIKDLACKRRIAQLALPFLEKASSIYIDASTTAYELLKILPDTRPMTVFTNSFAAFNLISNNINIRPFLIGGFLCKDHNTLDDETSHDIAKKIFVDVAVISCAGFSFEGAFNNAYPGNQIKRIMIGNARRTFLLADHTKSSSRGIFLLSSWDEISHFFSDAPLESTLETVIKQHGVTILT